MTLLVAIVRIELTNGALSESLCYKEFTPGILFNRVGANVPDEMNHDMCKDSCAELEEPAADVAGIADGNVCLCGTLGDRAEAGMH